MVSLSRCCLASRYKCTTTIYDTASKRSNERTNEQQQTHNRSAHMNTDGLHTQTGAYTLLCGARSIGLCISLGVFRAHTPHTDRPTDTKTNDDGTSVVLCSGVVHVFGPGFFFFVIRLCTYGTHHSNALSGCARVCVICHTICAQLAVCACAYEQVY